MRTPKNAPETAYERMVREGQIAPPSRRQLLAAALTVPDPSEVVAKGQKPLELEEAA